MKHFILLFLILSLHSATISAQSVSHEQALMDLVQAGQWFAAEDYYLQHRDNIHELIRLWYIGASAIPFNRHQAEAIDAFNRLIDNNAWNWCKPTLAAAFVFPLLHLYANVQEHEKAIELSQKWIELLGKDTDTDLNTRLGWIEAFTQAVKQFQHLDANPRLTITRNETESIEKVELLPMQCNSGIFFNAKWNGIGLQTYFDTGAPTTFIYNKSIAEKIGVKFNTNDTIVTSIYSRMITGIIENLELGEFTIRNVPVWVNIDAIDTTDSLQVWCDYLLNSMFDIVLGMCVIKRLGVIEFDFIDNTMSFPQKAETTDRRNLYIHNNQLHMNIEVCKYKLRSFFRHRR